MKQILPVFALLIVAGPIQAQPADARRPNIVFILADDLGWGDLSCYGNALCKTPSLDGLARRGTLFTQFYVCAPVCSPSRCAFFTAQYPARHRIYGHYATVEMNAARGMSNWLDPAIPNLAALLRTVGYATAHVGKWHLGSGPEAPAVAKYGFDFVGTGETGGAPISKNDPYFRARSSRLFVDETLTFLKENQAKPCYVQLWMLLTHATLNPSPEQLAPFQKQSSPNSPHKSARTIYNASLHDLDEQIGRLLKGLEDLGIAENTIVVFSSDNGPEDIAILNASHSGVGSAGPFRGRKRSLYEGGVRVPFLVCWPGQIPAGRIDDTSVVAGVDLLPSLCKLARVPVPAGHRPDGEDLSDVLLGKPRPRRTPLFWEWRFRIAGHVWNISPQLSIRDGDWKLLMNPDGSRVELYDIPHDRLQQNNLAEKHKEVVERLSAQLLAWQRDLPQGPRDPGAGSNDYPWPGSSPAAKLRKKG